MTEQEIKTTLALFRGLFLSQALLETLDDMGENPVIFRQQVKFHTKRLHEELLKIVGDPITALFNKDEELMMQISVAIDELSNCLVHDSPAIIASIPNMLKALREQFNEEVGDEIEFIKSKENVKEDN